MGDDDRTDQQDSPESGNGAAGNGNGEPGQ